MPGHLQEDQLKKIEDVQKKKLLQIEQNTIHDHLTKLQTWDLAEGQTLEERLQAHKESLIRSLPQLQENAAMQNAAQAQLAQANANAAAPGAPVQEHSPAKQTFKQRKEQARKAKEAKKRCPVGTADTYDCVEATSRIVQERLNAMKAVPSGTDVDTRVLGAFCQGYKVNKKGRPATPEDQAKADSDNAFLDAYLSKDVERRKPYLEKFCKELMDFPLSADTVSNAYLVKNVAQVKRITDKVGNFENVMKDPINKPYFDSLDPTDMELLKKKLGVLAQLGVYFINRMGGMGLNSYQGCYYDQSFQAGISTFQSNADLQQELVGSLTAGWAQQEQEILERRIEQDAAAAKQEVLTKIEVDLREQAEKLPEDMNFSSPSTGYATDELKRCRAMIEAHPDVYAANKPLIDQLYQELYRGFDIFNELSLESTAYRQVSDEILESKGDKHPMFLLTLKKFESIQKNQIAVRFRTSTISDALQFYFKESPLSDHAKKLLLELGQDEATLTLLDRQHKVRKIFLGENGKVAESNAALKRNREEGSSPAETRSSALQALEIRVSTSAAAKAIKELQGDTYEQILQLIPQKFHEFEDQGTDLSAVQKQMVQEQVGKTASKYVTGGGVDAIIEELLNLYGTYLNTEKSIQYLKFMTQTLQGAEVFSGDSGQMLWFLSQHLINIYAANYSEVGKTQASYQNGAAAVEVAQGACRSLLALPTIMRLSEEERAKLPEATQRLAAQYTALLKQVQQKIDPPAAEP